MATSEDIKMAVDTRATWATTGRHRYLATAAQVESDRDLGDECGPA